jgi:hypothetical protein
MGIQVNFKIADPNTAILSNKGIEMKSSHKFGIIGFVLGLISSVANTTSPTLIDMILGGAIIGGLGYGIGEWKDSRSKK